MSAIKPQAEVIRLAQLLRTDAAVLPDLHWTAAARTWGAVFAYHDVTHVLCPFQRVGEAAWQAVGFGCIPHPASIDPLDEVAPTIDYLSARLDEYRTTAC